MTTVGVSIRILGVHSPEHSVGEAAGMGERDPAVNGIHVRIDRQ